MVTEAIQSVAKHCFDDVNQAQSPIAIDLSYRRKSLQRLVKYLNNTQNANAIYQALEQDLGKCKTEAYLSEVAVIVSHTKYVLKHLSSWSKADSVSAPLAFVGTKSRIHYEPKGTCLCIGPWNYPFQLCMLPVIYGIAAGNRLVVKPSEYCPNVANVIDAMLSSLFPNGEIVTYQGGIPETTAILEQPFNHIYFTGSPMVGKIVMKAASKHLASVTLELGGKSPVVIDQSANIKQIAQRLAWGKWINAGQTCIAPDYVLVHESVYDELLAELKQSYEEFKADNEPFGEYTSVVNAKHYGHLSGLISDAVAKGANVWQQAESNAERLFMSPTVLTNVDDSMEVMHEEIFGPVLPVIPYHSLDEVISAINAKPKPLTLYIGSKSNENIDRIVNGTSSGGVVINDFLLGYTNPNLPFGGVNNSGIGKSFGKHGFVEFSNEKSIIANRFSPTHLVYPPYTNTKSKFIRILSRFM